MIGRMPVHPRRHVGRFGQSYRKPGQPGHGHDASATVPATLLLRLGILILLYFLWAAVAGFVAILLGWGIAWLVAGLVPVPRRYLTAGGITTLALIAAWLGPSVVGRVASHRSVAVSHHVARSERKRTTTWSDRQAQNR